MAKSKQQHLPTLEPPSLPDVDKLADDYAGLRDRRMALQKEESDKADLLWAKMKEHQLKHYEMPDGRTVDVVETEKVKVRKPKSEADDE